MDPQPRSPLFLSRAAAPLTAITGGRFHWLMCDDPRESDPRLLRSGGYRIPRYDDSRQYCAFFVDFR